MRAVRILLFVGMVPLTVGCLRPPALRGELAPAADAMMGSARHIHCPVVLPHSEAGSVRGCWARVGDTVAYRYTGLDGTVFTAGQQWLIEAEADAMVTFDSLANVLVREHGPPSLRCDREDSAWQLRDWRWNLGMQHQALLVAIPKVDLQTQPYLQRVTQLGRSTCDQYYSVPFAR